VFLKTNKHTTLQKIMDFKLVLNFKRIFTRRNYAEQILMILLYNTLRRLSGT